MGFDAESLIKLLVYWLIFQTIDVAATSVGLGINGEKAPWRLLPLLLIQRFSYRQLLYVVTIRSVLAAAKGRFVGWGKLIRTGTVKLLKNPAQERSSFFLPMSKRVLRDPSSCRCLLATQAPSARELKK